MRRLLACGMAALVLCGAVTGPMLWRGQQQRLAPVADISQFNPGNVISDAVFFDPGAMTVDDIARFIAVKGMNCKAGSDGTPCLKDYRQDTVARAADQYCTGYQPGAGETAAVIIAKAAQACGINPEVLLVVLQKEQSLVLNSGATLYARRYREAMGFACPDTSPCNPDYNGFQNQVYSAARQFQRYRIDAASFPAYRSGRTSNVYYYPPNLNAACGASPVYIQNQATAGLYTYTPYQPNRAALAAGYGSGDGCSSYGNRNFWLYFTDWFGSTQSPGQSAWQPLGSLDAVTAMAGNRVEVRGWAIDPDTTAPITVHAYVDGEWHAAATADGDRPDVAAMVALWGPQHGFDATVPITPGVHEVCVYAINVGAAAPNSQLGCRTVDSTGLSMGSLERAAVTEGQGVLSGWALDSDTTAPIAVHAYVNGNWAGQVIAADDRPDVAGAYPGLGAAHGYRLTVPLQPGENTVCTYGIDASGGPNPSLGCRTLTLQVVPVGEARITGGGASATVSGWAIDPETSAPIDVHVYVDGQWNRALTANLDRPDVSAALPDSGGLHGFAATVALAPGSHDVCVYAINVKQGSVNPRLGCTTVLIGVPPVGHLERAAASRAVVTIQGWALDPDVSDPIDVHLYVDGRFASVLVAGGSRPDVGVVYPTNGPAHGFRTNLVLSPGRHQVCGFAINVLGGGSNPSIGCLGVTVAPSVPPTGSLDGVDVLPGFVVARGWAYDPDVPTASLIVHVYLDGRYAGQLPAVDSRPDVAAAVPGAGEAHGFTAYFGVPPGRHTVCAYGIDTAGGVNGALGCRTVMVTG